MTNPVYIIAEAGVNHNGSIDLAKKLVDVAADAGADAVKFQTFKADKVVSKYAPKADYQKYTTDSSESQLEMGKKLELSQREFRELAEYCTYRRITFLSTPFDFESIELLLEIGLDTFKIPSGEITNLPYLRKIGSLGKKLILSTGMANLFEVGEAIDILMKSGTDKAMITVLHCNTDYPTKMEDVNLTAMITIKDEFNVAVGYSDHTLGIEVPVAAVALGASIIEKHFTLDKNMLGPDHGASLDQDELKAMIKAIRNIEVAMGDGIKKPSASELKNISIVRRSIVAARDIKKGEIFTKENITVKRPGTGISPMMWDKILGQTAPRDFLVDMPVEL
jgi:N,N'-diacetyllegionaminate synthase